MSLDRVSLRGDVIRLYWGMSTALVLGVFWFWNGSIWLFSTLKGWFIVFICVLLGTLPWWQHMLLARWYSYWKRWPGGWIFGWMGVTFFLLLLASPPARLGPGWLEWLPLWFWLVEGHALLLTQHSAWRPFVRRLKRLWKRSVAQKGQLWLVTVLVLIAMVWSIAKTGWGIWSSKPLNWQGYPAPLLMQHVVLSIGLVYIGWWLWERFLRARRPGGVWWVGLLWGCAWLVWWWVEPTWNYFLTMPMAPNYERYYPSSDAASFFYRSLAGRLGWGYNFEEPFLDKPGLYAVLNGLIHSGDRFAVVMFFWVGLLALSVVLAYFLGKRLHSVSFGVLLGAGLGLREAGAMIGAHCLPSVHVKNLMSEPLLRLVLLGLVVALIYSSERGKWQDQVAQGMLVGALAGWAALVRAEGVVVTLGVIVGYSVWGLRQWGVKKKVAVIAGVVGGVFLVWGPWMWRSAVLSQAKYPEGSVYHGSPWFFLRQVLAASEASYRKAEEYRRVEEAWLLSWLPESMQVEIKRIPVVGSVLGWSKATWQEWWAYIGRNVVTSWSAWPWTFRFHHVCRVCGARGLRPLEEGRPLDVIRGLMLGLNLGIWALGWVTIWRRIRWKSIVPWVVYGLYVLALAFGRTGGGRYIVPIDWVPLVYYWAGWLVFAYGMWKGWGLEIPQGWWEKEKERRVIYGIRDILKERRMMIALGLIGISVLGVGWERYEMWRVEHHPEWGPPRVRSVKLEDIAARMEALGVWEKSGITEAEFWERMKGQKWEAVWGYGYFPRFLRGGKAGREWIHHEKFEEDSLFLTVVAAEGVKPLAIIVDQEPEPIELGAEVLGVVCQTKSYDTRGWYLVAGLLVVGRQEKGGRGQVYVLPPDQWKCP